MSETLTLTDHQALVVEKMKQVCNPEAVSMAVNVECYHDDQPHELVATGLIFLLDVMAKGVEPWYREQLAQEVLVAFGGFDTDVYSQAMLEHTMAKNPRPLRQVARYSGSSSD